MKIINLTKETPKVLLSEKDLAHGDLTLPKHGAGLIILSQDKQNKAVTEILHKHRLGTLASDFLALDDFQATKLLEQVSLYTSQSPETDSLPLGYLASGTGVLAALMAASHHPELIKAIVILGGKPDEAMDFLSAIKVPVLLIAGGRDPAGLRSAQKALEKLNSHSALNVISRASAGFEETGAMEEAAQLAALWFLRYL